MPTNPSNHCCRSIKGWLCLVFFILLVIVIGAGLVWFYLDEKAISGEIQKDTYQAVFLSNGQVYFGQLVKVNWNHYKLDNVYYLQVSENIQPQTEEGATAESQQSQLSLVKLGNEVHQPQSAMILNRDQVLFWENLKEDSRVVQTIKASER